MIFVGASALKARPLAANVRFFLIMPGYAPCISTEGEMDKNARLGPSLL